MLRDRDDRFDDRDKIDQMTLAKKPTEVRLRPEMVEDFKRSVMVAQTPEPR